MEDGISAPENFKSLRDEAEGFWNKTRLTAKFIISSAGLLINEYLANSIAVARQADPEVYHAEKRERQHTMLRQLGQWAVEKGVIA